MVDPGAVVRAALGDVSEGSLISDGEGDQTFVVDGVPGFVQHGRIGDGVELLTITCLAATGQPLSPALDRWAHERNAGMLLGGIVLIAGEDGNADVLLRYCLPRDEDATRLRSVLLPVIAAAADVRRELAAS